jgi:hypothetical protein
VATGGVRATVAIDYLEYPGRTFDVDFTSPRSEAARRGDSEPEVAHQGDLTFVAYGDDGFDVYEFDMRIGIFTGEAYSVVVSNDAFCIWIGKEGGIASVDVSDPRPRTRSTRFSWTGTITDREIVHVGDTPGSIFVIDWTDPADPILVGEYTEPGLTTEQIAASTETVVVTNGSFPGDVVALPAHDPGLASGYRSAPPSRRSWARAGRTLSGR